MSVGLWGGGAGTWGGSAGSWVGDWYMVLSIPSLTYAVMLFLFAMLWGFKSYFPWFRVWGFRVLGF